ncbi:MAG: phosphoribosylamine--glycine ligase [Pseudomonadota bacterium]
MRVLIVGGGGREHALAWSIAASPLCDVLFVAPGNAGIAVDATCLDIAADDLDGLVEAAKTQAIDLVVIGPEAPLVAGLVDRLRAEGIAAFGPTAAAAALEASKRFTKDLCARHGIPTASYQVFTESGPALAYLREVGAPIVVKADGLAAGKGVTVAQTLEEAEAAVIAALDEGVFAEAGAQVVIEEYLVGEEASFHALVEGTTVVPLASAQDYKQVGEGDQGANTGGMGALSPAPVLEGAMAERVLDEIVRPTVAAMAAEGTAFQGVLYAGLMITEAGPKLIEYNVRFGDPECQVLCKRLRSDLLPALLAAADGGLAQISLRWRDEAALCVVMAAQGYPDAYEKGTAINGLEALAGQEAVSVFHAGTKASPEGGFLANGGRVLGVTALGADLRAAQAEAYAAVDSIDWPDGFCRRDIGWRVLDKRDAPDPGS